MFALLSWFDEQPDHLRRAVTSLKGFADVLVAVDGSYRTFPGGKPWSDPRERSAIIDAAHAVGLDFRIWNPAQRFDSEVRKRAYMFEFARECGATPDDWFLIVDGDMALGGFSPEARDKLAASDRDVAEVKWHDVMRDGKCASTNRFRSMFRALPGLTVERTHFLYTVPCDRCSTLRCPAHCVMGRRFLWHVPAGSLSDEPILDLFGDVTLHHFNSQRDAERKQRALDYYADRDARTLESAGDWR